MFIYEYFMIFDDNLYFASPFELETARQNDNSWV